MSIEALNWAFNLDLRDMAAKITLLALANHADEEGYCWPSVGRLASLSGCSEQTGRRALRRLERLAFIEREEKPGTSDLFQLRLSWLPSDAIGKAGDWVELALVGFKVGDNPVGKVVGIDGHPFQIGTPAVPPRHPTPTNVIVHPFHGGTRIITETSLNLSENREALEKEIFNWEVKAMSAPAGAPSSPRPAAKPFRGRRRR